MCVCVVGVCKGVCVCVVGVCMCVCVCVCVCVGGASEYSLCLSGGQYFIHMEVCNIDNILYTWTSIPHTLTQIMVDTFFFCVSLLYVVYSKQ